MKKEEVKRFVLIAMLKGFVHATVMPVFVMYIFIYSTNSVYSLATPAVYIGLASWIYIRSEDKDISKMIFFGTLAALAVPTMVYLILIMS